MNSQHRTQKNTIIEKFSEYKCVRLFLYYQRYVQADAPS